MSILCNKVIKTNMAVFNLGLIFTKNKNEYYYFIQKTSHYSPLHTVSGYESHNLVSNITEVC